MVKLRKYLLFLEELVFFSAAMLLLLYMVACLSKIALFTEDDRKLVPLTDEFLVESAEGNRATTTLPANFDVPDTQYLISVSTLPEDIREGDYLGYYCSFQEVSIYIDGCLRDCSSDYSSIFATDIPVNHLEFMDVHPEDAGKELRVVYVSPLRNFKGFMGRMAIGDKISIAHYCFKHRFLVVILGMGILFFGLVMLELGLSHEAHAHVNRSYKLLGYTGMFMGGWIVLQSCICQIFFSDVAWCHWMELMCFIFLPIPLLYYMDECTHGLYWQMIQPVCMASLSFIVIATILTLGGYDGMRFIVLIHLFMILSVLLGVWILFDIFRTRRDMARDLYFVFFGFIGFLISVLIEVGLFYFHLNAEDGLALSIGAVIFFLCNYIWLQKQRVFYMVQEQSEKSKVRTKNLFLANMSHEIRTPVNTILIANAMIEQESKDEKTRQLAADAMAETRKLLGLINDILDYSKIVSKNMVVEHSNYDVVWFLRDVYRLIDKFRENVPTLQVDFHCNKNLPSYLNGDEAKIRRILENVLENLFGDATEGTIGVYVDFHMYSDRKVLLLITVEDVNRNISLEKQQIVMDVLSNRTPLEEDAINANLVDEMLRLMGGELELVSEDTSGIRLTLRIPQQLVDETPIGEKNAKSIEHAILLSSNRLRHILLVDDEEMNHRVFKEMLRGERVEITEVYSGEDALNAIKETHFDVIFMDNQMPGINGVTTLQLMQEYWMKMNTKIPCILLTAGDMTLKLLKSYGFDGYLTKPIDRQNLLSILKRLEEGGSIG